MRNLSLPNTWFGFFLIVVLVLGVFFRFVNLDKKVYWHDEAYTSLRISGYTSAEVNQQLFNGQVIGIEDLQKYQRPNSEKGLIDTIKALAIDDAQHPPLYYILVRFWVQLFGNSVAVTRSLSVLFSLLVFPCVYWLCLELFESPLVGWVAIALIAVSPFHVLYAQEAREYSLWTVTILLSSATLLRALRLTTKDGNKTYHIRAWGIYAATLALSIYTFPFSVLVGIGHGIYVIVIEGFRFTKKVAAFVLASLMAVLLFSPWLVIAIATWSETGANWTAVPIPLIAWLKTWGIHINRAFILTQGDFGFDTLLTYLTLPIFLILVSYSIYFICKNTKKEVWLFVLTLMGTLTLALVLPDLILGGQRSTSSRYIVPFYLGIQLSIAYLLATGITSARFLEQKFWQIVMAALISAGIVSCAINSQAETAWNKVVSYHNYQVSEIVNEAKAPLLITNSFGINFGNSLALSYVFEEKVRLMVVPGNTQPDFMNILNIPQGFSDVFLLNLSEQFQEKIKKESNFKIEPLYNDNFLWLSKLVKP
ncbi:glycosyltransferase family 39 protein [Funiculus sociatus GB2-A5]|uniref:Glycosyltransferase family 39 protein n=1 Tax=Funiculus sociatus GB2-A5 TaxID=2933946 RepID=A0ABV0JPG6_9CYAN|nr:MULTISPECIES: glycosyltransferase family 39 protein [unclassified Trichocoleus]MBD1908216.1 glycosyltransferase family 39 protein [Trichocoleus sp. FACHB-832]MBD2061774.1 glycosyltransferase family 39 protein [Trichocoleus sp. FACHB-6]